MAAEAAAEAEAEAEEAEAEAAEAAEAEAGAGAGRPGARAAARCGEAVLVATEAASRLARSWRD